MNLLKMSQSCEEFNLPCDWSITSLSVQLKTFLSPAYANDPGPMANQEDGEECEELNEAT